MNMIEEIKKTLKMEIRPNSEGKEYLEAVIVKKDLNLLESLLKKHLGQVALESGKEPQLPEAVQKILDSLGGLWHGQSFFHKQKGDEVLFAALWPWESNPDKVTLKAGMRKLVSKKTGK
jgi:hypothetical protein